MVLSAIFLSSRKSSNCPQVSSNHSHIAQYLATSSGGCGVAVLVEQPLRRVVGRVRHHRRVPEEERRPALLGHADEVEDRLHSLTPDGEPEVAVAAAASRVAVRHSVCEPAA